MYEDDSEQEEYAYIAQCEGCSCSLHVHTHECCNAHDHLDMNDCWSAHDQWSSNGPTCQWEKDGLPAEWGDRFHKLRNQWSGHFSRLQPYRHGATNHWNGCANCSCITNTLAYTGPHYSPADNCFFIPNWSRKDKFVHECPCSMEKYVPLRECSCWKRIANDCQCQCLKPEEYQPPTPQSSTGEQLSGKHEEYPFDERDCSHLSSTDNLLEETEERGCVGVLQVIEDCNPKNISYPACAYSCDCISRDSQRTRRAGQQDRRNGTPRWPRKDQLPSRRSMSAQLFDTRFRGNRNDLSYDEAKLDEWRSMSIHEQSSRVEAISKGSLNSNENEGNEVEEYVTRNASEAGLNTENTNAATRTPNSFTVVEEGLNDLSKEQDNEDSEPIIEQPIDEATNTLLEINGDERNDANTQEPESNDALYLYHNKDLFTPSSSVIIKKDLDLENEIKTISLPTPPPLFTAIQIPCSCKKVTKHKPAIELSKKKGKRRISFDLEKKKNSSDLTEGNVATRKKEKRGGGILKNERVCAPCGRSRPGTAGSHRRRFSRAKSN